MSLFTYAFISLVAFGASFLTLFSGFGLGTILTPAFAFFFPIEIAIAMTAIIHLANNIVKLFLVGKKADRKTVLYFGIPAAISAVIGALLLNFLFGMRRSITSFLEYLWKSNQSNYSSAF
jgi:uncharacterized membrane protein YfcA